MTQFKEKTTQALESLEDAYFELLSKPEIDMSAQALRDHSESLRELMVGIMKLETANLAKIKAAFETEGARMNQAVKAMEEAVNANTDYLTMLYSVDNALDIMKHFFLLL